MPATARTLRIGTAGWSIAQPFRGRFPNSGSALERYAAQFDAVEINSSFYRPHRPQTYLRWAASVPGDFRFAMKFPKLITHERRLHDVGDPLDRFLAEVGSLGEKLGPLLLQLPPSLAFDAAVAGDFLALLRARFGGSVVCEPRHATWFTPEAETFLGEAHVARVAADPSRFVQAAAPGGWPGLAYYRLHGSPRRYYSEYGTPYLEDLAGRLAVGVAAENWCVFDNTASGAALSDALTLRGM
jgi:uncharacterized protein YecE (DUF72 family)